MISVLFFCSPPSSMGSFPHFWFLRVCNHRYLDNNFTPFEWRLMSGQIRCDETAHFYIFCIRFDARLIGAAAQEIVHVGVRAHAPYTQLLCVDFICSFSDPSQTQNRVWVALLIADHFPNLSHYFVKREFPTTNNLLKITIFSFSVCVTQLFFFFFLILLPPSSFWHLSTDWQELKSPDKLHLKWHSKRETNKKCKERRQSEGGRLVTPTFTSCFAVGVASKAARKQGGSSSQFFGDVLWNYLRAGSQPTNRSGRRGFVSPSNSTHPLMRLDMTLLSFDFHCWSVTCGKANGRQVLLRIDGEKEREMGEVKEQRKEGTVIKYSDTKERE